MLKVASLFCGGGGLDLGIHGGFEFSGKIYENNNFEIVFSNDFDKDALLTHEVNSKYFKSGSLFAGDIKDIKSEEIPEFDILFAGFPCQPFSNAGKRKGVNDDNGRGNLWEECERIINHAVKNFKEKPKAFVFENVRGIMSSKAESGRSVPEEIKYRMEKLGYSISMKLLIASEYGVPQNRYRYIIVGIRNDYPTFKFEEMDDIVNSKKIPSIKTNPYKLYLGSILCDIPKDAPQRDIYWKYSPQGQYMIDKIGSCIDGEEALDLFIKNIPPSDMPRTISIGRSWKNINPDDLPNRFRKIYDDPKKYHSPNFYRRFALGEIAGTITASAQPEKCGITHPYEPRRMTIREVARIQSFPDDFIFPCKTAQSNYKVIGNAVPPVLGWVISRALQNHLMD